MAPTQNINVSSADLIFTTSDGNDDGSGDRGGTEAPRTRNWRNLVSFWLFGLCNNYAYVIMLSAAHDILSKGFQSPEVVEEDNGRDCNPTSSGAILLADILPALFTKLISPTVNVHTHVRVSVSVLLSALSFILVGTSVNSAMTYLGVVCASFSSGLGEASFLSYSAFFHKDVISTWSSGTGFSGVLASFSYAALTTAGVTPRNTLLIMLICPVIMTGTYVGLTQHPATHRLSCCRRSPPEGGSGVASSSTNTPLSRAEKVRLLRQMPAYMVPLGLVYLAEYFINQGLVELVWFKGMWLSHSEQYRWLQVDYQIGVFLSRSSVNLLHIQRVWILTVLQGVNAVFFLLEAYFLFLPSFWLVVVLVLWEGLLGGAAYVNTFYSIYNNVADRERAFFLGVVPLADSMGIAIAGAISLPVHDALCKLPFTRT